MPPTKARQTPATTRLRRCVFCRCVWLVASHRPHIARSRMPGPNLTMRHDVEDDDERRERQPDRDERLRARLLLACGQRDASRVPSGNLPAAPACAGRPRRPDRRRRSRRDRAAKRQTAPWPAAWRGRRRASSSTFQAYQTKAAPSANGDDAVADARHSRARPAARRPAGGAAHRRRSAGASTPARRRSASSGCRRGRSRRALKSASAQKCGGVHRKMIRKRTTLSRLTEPVTAAQPITGGKAPAAPPMTMFCGVQRFSHIV